MFVVFDLDGTLALNEHRQHFVDRPVGEKDWDAFFEACDLDMPNTPIIDVLLSLESQGHTIEIWSGRKDSVLSKTQAWLVAHGLSHIPIKMRKSADHQADTTLKRGWLDDTAIKPDLVFEDRNSVVKMWRENGVACCQVAEGDF